MEFCLAPEELIVVGYSIPAVQPRVTDCPPGFSPERAGYNLNKSKSPEPYPVNPDRYISFQYYIYIM